MARLIHRVLPLVALGALLLPFAFAAPAADAAPFGQTAQAGDSSLAVESTLAAAPDLIVERLTFRRTESSCDLQATIRNQGTNFAGSFTVRHIGSYPLQSVAGLPAGSFITLVFHVSPYGTSGQVIADWYHQVLESNESNNARSWWIACRDNR